jgi:quinol monooxygenase YgiN
MRTSALLSFVVVLTFAPPAVSQDWAEYTNREDGFRVDFPGQPSVQQTSWASEYGYTLSGPAGAAAAPAAAAPPAGQPAQAAPPAPPEGPRTVVTYLEVAPASDKEAAALLVKYRDATRRDGGNTGADVFQQNGRAGHFVVVEQWRDDASWKGHRGLPHTAQFHEKLTPLRVGPYDERWHSGIAGGSGAPASAGSVLVVTHIDVTGQGAPKVREMLRTLSDTSRKESGNLRFDALQGVRQNHFTVVEGWRDERAREAHVSSGHAKTFREGLYGFAVDGAPYDERLYRVLGP